MDANRAELELEKKKLQTQLDTFQTELDTYRIKFQKLTDENENLRRDLRRSVDERLSGLHPDALSNIKNDSVVEILKKQIELLEDEKDNVLRLYDQSQLTINRLEEENNDLKNPLKPHLIKLDMQAKQAQEDHARAEVELVQEINMIRDELAKRNRDLTNCQLSVKELERENIKLQTDVQQKEDDLRKYLRKEIGYDGTLVAFQTSMDNLEVRLTQALKEKENALKQREEMEIKLKELTNKNQSLEEKLIQTIEHFQHEIQLQPTIDHRHDIQHDQFNHERIHQTIEELIEQAAAKTCRAVQDVRQQYDETFQRMKQEYHNLETELTEKQTEFDKCLRAKRSIEEELEKISKERRLHLEKSALDNEDLAKRCLNAERERDDIQIKFETIQQKYKILQQSFDAEKLKHENKEKELNERLQKTTNDLDKMTRDYTATFNELNELKKKFSTFNNEQNLLQKRMTELIKRHEQQIIDKEKDCLIRLKQRDDVNSTTFNELRNLVNQQQRMIVKYKEECHMIASQSETKINELKQKIENLRSRNEQLQSEISDVKRKEVDMDRILAKNANRIKGLEERLHDAEEQAIEASRRVAKQLVRDRLALMPSDHYSYSITRPMHSTSLFNLTSPVQPIASSNGILDSIEHDSNGT